jgi:endo-1,4-beta-xylanase
MKKSLACLLLLSATVSLTQCSSRKSAGNSSAENDTTVGLKDRYAKLFPIGVAVSTRALRGRDSALIVREFNSVTPENDMKMGPIHPAENRYNWAGADAIVAFAERNKLRIRGHNLCWHSQAPNWMFTDSTGKTVTKEVLLKRLKDHIIAVAGRYKGKLYAWDVVNEAISDKPEEYLRPSPWYQICGEEYIAAAFRYAHEVDPSAALFYNDYNEISSIKREKIYRLVKSLKDAGVPIHGVGLQAHWAVNEPSREQLDSTIKRFADLGLQVQITEMDISVYPKEHDARPARPEDAFTQFTKEREAQQLEKYKMSFELFRKYKKSLTGVTFWNISDRSSWLDNFPVRNRKDYPLLFDTIYQRKQAYTAITKF